jgi:hypothetical protein
MKEFMTQIWTFLSGYTGEIITGIILLVIGYLLGSSKERKKEQDKRLKTHFEDLKNELQKGITLTKTYWKIEVTGSPQFSDSFRAHFPETLALEKCLDRIYDHNIRYGDFCLGIETRFESKGIPVANINYAPDISPYIYGAVLRPLFVWWKDRQNQKAHPQIDFKNIEAKPDGGPNNLFVAGWGGEAVAYGETDHDRERCREIIREVAQDKYYEKEVAELMSTADKLVGDVELSQSRLNEKLEDTHKFWPGTRKYKFKQEKSCPRCRELSP